MVLKQNSVSRHEFASRAGIDNAVVELQRKGTMGTLTTAQVDAHGGRREISLSLGKEHLSLDEFGFYTRSRWVTPVTTSAVLRRSLT